MSLELQQALASITIGTLMAATLYGATCIQTFVYFRTSQNDLIWIKVANYGNPAAFLVLTWSYKVGDRSVGSFSKQSNITDSGAAVHTLISEKRQILRIVIVTAIGCNYLHKCDVSLLGTSTNEPLFSISTSMSIASDLFIAATLCIILARNRSGVKRTDSLIMVLIIFIFSTGLLMSSLEIAAYIMAKMGIVLS
ncbi:hypothetical protein BDQ17DRAFT_1414721 [Cyathus striatus]|nr:hypothetical protein BDQ17DRAFT_1414721 [Cyathus striatus]